MNDYYNNLANKMKKYVEELKELHKNNPELAKKIAKESLQGAGIIDKDGKFVPPYNGQKVQEDDYTRGPGEIDYEGNER